MAIKQHFVDFAEQTGVGKAFWFAVATTEQFDRASAAVNAAVASTIANFRSPIVASINIAARSIFAELPIICHIVNITLIVDNANSELVLAICLHGSGTYYAKDMIKEFLGPEDGGTTIDNVGGGITYGFNVDRLSWFVRPELIEDGRDSTFTEMKTILEENGILGEIETQQAAEFDVQADEEPEA